MKHYTLLYAAPPARHACFAVNVFLFFGKKRSGGDDADSRTIIFSFPIKEERGGAEKTTLPSSLSIKKKNAAEIPP